MLILEKYKLLREMSKEDREHIYEYTMELSKQIVEDADKETPHEELMKYLEEKKRKKEIPLTNLSIIGYATKLLKTMLPTIVSPIFSLNTAKQTILFPPFQIVEGKVIEGTLSNMKEFKSLITKQSITAINNPLSAQKNYELWVDEDFCTHYASIEVVNKTLNTFAKASIIKAEKALKDKDFERAIYLSNKALVAGKYLCKAIAIKASIAHYQHKHTKVKVLVKMLGKNITDIQCFNLYFKQYLAAISNPL